MAGKQDLAEKRTRDESWESSSAEHVLRGRE